MKKLFFVLLCFPFFIFSQSDCGEKPKKPKKEFGVSNWDFKQSKEFRKWKSDVEIWEICSNGLDTIKYYEIDFPLDSKTGLVSFEEVIRCDSIPKEQIYSIIREWFVTSFVDAETVLQMDDSKSGKLIGKSRTILDRQVYSKKWGTSNVKFNIWSIRDIKFTLKIYIREGRFKYTLTSLSFYRPFSRGMYFNSPESERDVESFMVKYPMYDKKGRVTHSALMKNEVFLLNNMISNSLNDLVTNYLTDTDDDW